MELICGGINDFNGIIMFVIFHFVVMCIVTSCFLAKVFDIIVHLISLLATFGELLHGYVCFCLCLYIIALSYTL